MRKTTRLFLAFGLTLLSLGSIAQGKLSIENVYKVTLRNSGTIVENEQIRGYFFFYQSDKIDRKTNEYTLQVVDENLNKVKDIKFTDSKDIVLLESSYNGNSMAFLFYNSDTRTMEYRLFNMTGKASYTYTKELDKKTSRWMEQRLRYVKDEENENQNVFDIAGKGYLSITPIREDGKYTYDVNFYASGKRKAWTYNPMETEKYTDAQYLGSNDSIAIIEVLSKKRAAAKEMESTLLGLNLETGKKVFEIRTTDKANQLYPMNISTLQGSSSEFLLIGPYYAGGDKVGDKSDGLGIWLMNNQGKILKSKYITWERDLSKYLKVDSKGRLEDMGWVYFHKMVQTEDGKIFAIGEGYKKVADGLGIAASVLSAASGGGYYGGVTKLVITNMVMLELSPEFELKNARVIEKNRNSFSLMANTDFLSPHTLALVAKSAGSFDYSYTQVGQNRATFTTAYTDYERTKDYKGLAFHTLSYYDGKISEDKINLKSKATSTVVMPGKPGSVLIMEYFKKEKKLDMRMEKIN
jgi:hypothetical protein